MTGYYTNNIETTRRWLAEHGGWGVIASDGTTVLAVSEEWQGKTLCQIREAIGEQAWRAAVSDIVPEPISPPRLIHSVDGSKWPLWAKIIGKLRSPEDAGVGDTIHRMLGMQGESFKAQLKADGAPCACDRRQVEWNAKYHYTPTA